MDKDKEQTEVEASDSIRAFEEAIPYSEMEKEAALVYIVSCREHLTEDNVSVLRDLCPMEKPNEILDIDLKFMMQEQMNASRALRLQYFNADGSLRLNVDHKDARDALKAAQTIMDSILKKQDKIDLSSKLMIMEQSLLIAAQELPKELQDKFYERVDRLLGEQ